MTTKEVLKSVKGMRYRKEAEGFANVDFFADSHGTVDVHVSLPLAERVTPLVAHIFSSGQCHALAVALHEIMGWPIVGCWSRYRGDHSSHHIALQHPKGFTADIHGIRCIDWNHRKMSAAGILRRRNMAFFPPAMKLARHYAPEIADAIRKDEDRSIPWPWER